MSRRPKESEVSFQVNADVIRQSRCPHESRHESGYELAPKYLEADWFGTRWAGLGIQVSARISTRVRVPS
ncbi:unnamed protein product [Sphagnum troendelagicum]